MTSDQSQPTPPTQPGQPMTFLQPEQQRTDREHLKILAVLHYVYGALTAVAGCAGTIYIVLGIAFAANPSAFDSTNSNSGPPPAFMGTMFIVLGGCIMLVAWALGGLVIYAGRCLANQKNRVFCMIVAGVMCLSIPLGTLLGVFTLIVLSRPSVAHAFAQTRLSQLMHSA